MPARSARSNVRQKDRLRVRSSLGGHGVGWRGTMRAMRLRFTKMRGIGNDYVYVNVFDAPVTDAPRIARLVSPRRTAIGSDGLILIAPSAVADVRMEMYNADGSRGQMCGNGIRCVAKYAYEHGLARRPALRVETDCGIRTLTLEVRGESVESVTVDMGAPDLSPTALPIASEARLVDVPFVIDGEEHRITCI